MWDRKCAVASSRGFHATAMSSASLQCFLVLDVSHPRWNFPGIRSLVIVSLRSRSTPTWWLGSLGGLILYMPKIDENGNRIHIKVRPSSYKNALCFPTNEEQENIKHSLTQSFNFLNLSFSTMHPFTPFILYAAAVTAFPTLNHYVHAAKRDALAPLPGDQAAIPVVAGRQLSLPNGGVRTLQSPSSTSTSHEVPTPPILIGGKHTLSSCTTTHQSIPTPTILTGGEHTLPPNQGSSSSSSKKLPTPTVVTGGEHTLAPNSASSTHQKIAPAPLNIVIGGERPLVPHSASSSSDGIPPLHIVTDGERPLAPLNPASSAPEGIPPLNIVTGGERPLNTQ